LESLTPHRIAMILINVVLGSMGQICLKQGMRTASIHLSGGFLSKIQSLLTIIFTNPFVFGGFALYAASSLLWLAILKSVPLSLAYPTIALSYVIVTFLSWALFGEYVNWVSLTGLLFICCGVTMVGIGLRHATVH
jgi:multidrug transporter EmrE-like cation transporter